MLRVNRTYSGVGERNSTPIHEKMQEMHYSLWHFCEMRLYVGAGSVSGCSWGYLQLNNLSYKCSKSYVHHVGNRETGVFAPNPPLKLCVLWPDMTFGIFVAQRTFLWATKWPCMIPLLVSKPSADSWLLNSTCKPVAKQNVCCQRESSHVGTSGKVI